MIPKRLPFAFVPLCALVNPVVAQTSPCLPYAPSNSFDWPASGYGSAADFRRVVAGKFSGSTDADGSDAIMLVDDALVRLMGINYQTAMVILNWVPVAEQLIEDVAVLPNGIASGKDGLVVSDADGLHLVELLGGASYTATTVGSSNPWASSHDLQGADLDADGTYEIIGVASDDATVLEARKNGTSWTTTSFLTPGAILDFEAFDWTPVVAGKELAVLMTDRLAVYAANGTLLRTFWHSSTHGQIARVRVGGTSDVLAWSRLASGSGDPELVTVRLTTVSSAQLLEFDVCGSTIEVDPVTLTGADYNGDGFDDLLLTYEEDETAIAVVNTGTSTSDWFDLGDPDLYDALPLVPGTPGAGTGNDCIPFFGDLDGNAIADIVLGVSTPETAEMWRNPAYKRQIEAVEITSATIARPETEMHPDTSYGGGDHGELYFGFNVPEDYQYRTHIEVIVFDQDTPLNYYVAPTADYHLVFQLEKNGSVAEPVQYVILGALKEGDIWADRKHYYMRYRFVDASGTPNPTNFLNPSSWFVGGWTIRHVTTDQEVADMANYYMMDNGGISGSAFGINLENGIPGQPQPEQSTALGAYVPMTRVPPFPPGSTPSPGPAYYSSLGAASY